MNCASGMCGIKPVAHCGPRHHHGHGHGCCDKSPCAPMISGQVNVIDMLYSNRTRDALSANMGRVLRELIEEAEMRIDDLVERVDILEDELEKLKDRVDVLEEKVEDLENRVDQIEQEIIQIKNDILEINNKIEIINQQITTIIGRLDDIDQKIINIQNSITNINNRIDAINNAITTINNRLTNIEGDITNINNAITDIRNEINNVIGSDITEIQNKLDTIETGAQKNVQSDWNVTSASSDAYIRNKPVIPSIVQSVGQGTDVVMSQKAVTDALTSSGAGVQSDWSETDTGSYAYILNKPNIPSNANIVQSTGQSTTDLMSQKAVTDALGSSGANVQSDWTVTDTSSFAYIQNKPNIPSNTSIVQSTGQSTTDIMSQKAVTDALIGINNEITNINQELDLKADKDNTYTKSEVDDLISAVQGGPGFGRFTVGDVTVTATTPNDLMTLVAGDNISLTGDATAKTITIASTGGGSASVIHKSVSIPTSGWSGSANYAVARVTDADIVDGSFVEAWPSMATQPALELCDPYADLQVAVGNFQITLRAMPSSTIVFNYTIIG